MGRKPSMQLSQRHTDILWMMAEYQEAFGYPPTIREIGQEIGVSSTSQVNYYLQRLEKTGYIKREEYVSRGLRLLKLPEELKAKFHRLYLGIVTVPVLGRIVAGEPIPIPTSDFSLYDPESSIEISASMLSGSSKDLFALEVQGDSMIDAMINEGDIVVLRPAQRANNGDLVAAWLEAANERATTLKHYFLENGRVRLQPANHDYKPILVDPDKVTIQGKVVLVVRRLQ